MRYINPDKRKRPNWSDFQSSYRSKYGCICGKPINDESDLYRHWLEGHFDLYDEVEL